MNKQDIEKYILKKYKAKPEHLWMRTPQDEIFRHTDNNKWFAIIMTVKKEWLGLEGNGTVDVMNVKGDPAMILSLCTEDGFRPAYHMNKEKWISIILDGTAEDNTIKSLLEMSFNLTKLGMDTIKKETGRHLSSGKL